MDLSDMPDEDLETEPLSCSHLLSETLSTPAGRLKERPVPAPRRRKEETFRVDTPIPSPHRSQRTTAGKTETLLTYLCLHAT